MIEMMQSTLLLNDKRLVDIDSKRAELTKKCQEEEQKITTVCSEIMSRVASAVDALKSKSMSEFNRIDEELSRLRKNITEDSLVLCSELDKMNEVTKSGKGIKLDVQSCWDRVKVILSAEDDLNYLVQRGNPTFHASKTLAKVKSSDLGFINTAEFLPSHYQLSLTFPTHSVLEVGGVKKAVCTVFTNQLFTDMIQANIKFSIKNKVCKEAVPYCKEECRLSEDKKKFQIAFMMTRPGTYVVTVLLYDQHVLDSPLTIIASEQKNSINEDDMQQQAIQSQVSKTKDHAIDQLDQGQGKSGIQSGQDTSQSPSVSVKLVMKSPVSLNENYPHSGPSSSQTARLSQTTSPTNSRPAPSSSASKTSSSQRTIPSSSRKPSSTPADSRPPSLKSLIPDGPLDLSHLPPGSKLAGLRMLSIEEGVKQECLHKPIGMCLLPNGNIAVASTFEGKVKIFTQEGKFLSQVVSPEPPFDRPSDMVTLQSGQFVVRDNSRVQVFSANGNFMKNMWQDKGHDKCYGLAQDNEGRLVTIMESRRPRKTDLLFFDLDTGKLVKKIEMEDIITNKAMSKCRFLTYELGKLYITDLGLDCVYILDPNTINAKVFGSSGTGDGELSDPAGLVVDIAGNIIVADSKNHRLCVFSGDGKFMSNVSLSPDTRRPSGVVLDKVKKELFVLNLQGKFAMTKYKLK